MTAIAANYRIFDLPWTPEEGEQERLKKTARIFLIVFALIGIVIPLIPMSERPPPPALPEEVVKLVLEPPPPPPPKPEAKEPEPPKPEAMPEPKPVEPPKPVDRQAEARKKAENAGLLAMKDQLEDLREAFEPVQSSSAPLIGRVEGASRAERALVTGRTGVGSGGINTGQLSAGFGSGPGNLKGHATGTAAPSFADRIGDAREQASRTGTGSRASRSREEIEIVFDRNKSAIYALYSRALREQPELQGKVVVQLTIAPSGEVTDCRIVSTELGDAELERKLVARIRMFRFDARDVEAMTTTKPIEFFPA
ncbi:MAG TPA: AgmX/PglI C-terminal domain-containing protein [Steroidobacteraceae bacterium]|jgi:protein TonB|nr:AgmX/PglI C-terminal domain-containing protein [Steroidobacteraceae bacterium]